MALPREPRQKMINIMYLVLTAILALNVSAEVINAFRVVDASLINSNTNISSSNEVLYKSLNDKLSDPKQNQETVKYWNGKALDAKKYSADLDNYINGLKQKLKEAAGLRIVDGKEDFKADNLDASTRLFETNGEGTKLKKMLEDYKNAMLALDPKIGTAFANNFPVSTDVPVSQEGGKKDFTTSFFHMTPTVAALTMLSKFQNNVKNAESQVVTFCHNQVGTVEVHMDQVGILVGQSSNYLMPGEEITVTAGIGAYSSTVKSNLTVNGSPINLVNGQGEYKTKVSGSGKHTIQVSGSFIGEDGKPVAVNKTIEYVVGTPGGAAVMLDKMNVFYIGVDNPVTIGSTTGWDKTNVTISGGGATISGAGSKRTVKVTTPGECNITVTADGKSTSFPFRVKRIPDPIIKVGPSGGGKMQAVIFRSQPFVRADLENFDFEAKFNVTGATVYFTNPGDRNVKQVSLTSGSLAPAAEYMKTLVPGSTVIFDNIRVVGPDGQARTIQNPPGFSLF